MNLKIKIGIVALFTMLMFQSCNKESSVDKGARVQLKLVDAAGDYLKVNVEIVDVQYKSSENGWVSFRDGANFPMRIDLTELIAGNSVLLAEEIIPVGSLHQIRLILGNNNDLVIEGALGQVNITTLLDTPSALQSGLKLNLNTEIEAGFSYTFILDWDVQKSIVSAGASGKYNLKPVIRVNAEVNSGSIKGNVIGDKEGDSSTDSVALEGITVYAYLPDGTESIASTTTDELGNFIIQGLGEIEGGYIIKIQEERFTHYESNTISVTIGNVEDTGVIELDLT
jgi:hypothetical protein